MGHLGGWDYAVLYPKSAKIYRFRNERGPELEFDHDLEIYGGKRHDSSIDVRYIILNRKYKLNQRCFSLMFNK